MATSYVIQKKLKIMKPIYWVITVLAAGAIGAGAIYYANQPALDVGPVAVHHAVKSNMVVASPSAASSSPIDISGWKTYTNSHAGFEIKFPQGWSMPAAYLQE